MVSNNEIQLSQKVVELESENERLLSIIAQTMAIQDHDAHV